MNEFDKISKDILIYITLKMDISEIFLLGKSCKRFNKLICSNQMFWINKIIY